MNTDDDVMDALSYSLTRLGVLEFEELTPTQQLCDVACLINGIEPPKRDIFERHIYGGSQGGGKTMALTMFEELRKLRP